jgi:HEAT repeat protein
MEKSTFSCSSIEEVNLLKTKNVSPKTLKKLVRSRDIKKRTDAAWYLLANRHYDDEFFDHLKRLIRDEEGVVWKAAANALGNYAFADPHVNDYVMELVDDDFFWIKTRGIYALGEYAKYDHRGIAKLTKLTKSTNEGIVSEAITILGNVARENQKAQKELIKLTKSKDDVILNSTIRTMGLLAGDNPDILSELEELLKSPNNFIRLWSATAIGEAAMENDHALSLLSNFTNEEDVYLRRGFSNKLAVLTKKEPKKALELINEAKSDPDRYVRMNAVSSLGSLCKGRSGAFAMIADLLHHENADIRRGAAHALLDVPSKMNRKLIPLVLEMMEDGDYYLRSKAAFLSIKIANTDPKENQRLLSELAKDKDEYVRRDLALAIRNLPLDTKLDVLPILQDLIKDRESLVRREAVLSLKIPAKKDPEKVLSLISKLTYDNDENIRENACEILCSLVDSVPDSILPYVLAYSRDGSSQVIEKAAFCLERLFDQNPKKVFELIRTLQKEEADPKIFYMISKMAKSQDIGWVCQFYFRLSSQLMQTNMETSLMNSLPMLKRARSLKQSRQVENLYRTFLNGIRVRDINDLALIRFDSEGFYSIYGPEDKRELQIFEVLNTVPDMALKFLQIEGISDKHIFLGKMLGAMDSKFEELSQNPIPESEMFEKVLHSWRFMVSQTMESLKGRSELKIFLRTKRVIPQESVTLLLGIENVGESLAQNITISVLPSPTYKIVDRTTKIEMLAHDRKDAVEIRIKPSKKKAFRVKFEIVWDDFEKTQKSMVFADRVSFIAIPKEFRYIPNPYITGGPIKPRSKEMFFGREDVFRFVSENLSSTSQKNVLILQGERRTGKTSILYQIPEVLGEDYICVFMDGQEFGASTLEYFFYKMAKLTAAACKKEGLEVSVPEKSRFEEDPWYMFKDIFLEDLKPLLGEKSIAILFDEFEALEHAVLGGNLNPQVFNYVRNLMQHEDKLVFIFAGVHRLEEMMENYWGVMFNIAMYWKISFLEEEETRKLISDPVLEYNMIYDDIALEKMVRATASHPYFVQLLCRFLVNRHNHEKKNYVTVQDVNEELANVIEKAKPHFDYIWTLSSPYEKLIMSLLVANLRVRNIVTRKDLLAECERLKISVNKKTVTKALSKLVDKDILKMMTNGAVHYDFKVDFIRMWVERYHPLSKLLQDFGEEFVD